MQSLDVRWGENKCFLLIFSLCALGGLRLSVWRFFRGVARTSGAHSSPLPRRSHFLRISVATSWGRNKTCEETHRSREVVCVMWWTGRLKSAWVGPTLQHVHTFLESQAQLHLAHAWLALSFVIVEKYTGHTLTVWFADMAKRWRVTEP